jgi:hypothetical protein
VAALCSMMALCVAASLVWGQQASSALRLDDVPAAGDYLKMGPLVGFGFPQLWRLASWMTESFFWQGEFYGIMGPMLASIAAVVVLAVTRHALAVELRKGATPPPP